MKPHPMWKRNPATARGISEILGLPADMVWLDAKLEVETDEPAVVTLRIAPTSEQAMALLELATRNVP